jgi:predicted dehydrogenase
MLSVALVGCGLWGPNLARIFFSHPRTQLKTVFDIDAERASKVSRRLRGVAVTDDFRVLLEDKEIDAVLVATPLVTHFDIAKALLEAGKHVFVEKPLTPDHASSEKLKILAEKQGRVLMTGYVFLFNPALRMAIDQIKSGILGDLHYITATRTNLGPIRSDTSVLWDLASHDVSVMLHCLGEDPVTVTATGGFFLGNPRADVVSASIRFLSGKMGFLYASWLDPCKVRRVTFVGENKMILFDDMMASESLKFFDKGVVRGPEVLDTYGGHQLGVRHGDVLLPRFDPLEPLGQECEAFIEACLDEMPNPAMGELPVKVTRILSALQLSMENGGCPVQVDGSAKGMAIQDSSLYANGTPLQNSEGTADA